MKVIPFKKRLTKAELFVMSQRVDTIHAAIDLCGEYDGDVLASLEEELNVLIKILEESMQQAELEENLP